jgi:hypothetical protein
VISMRLESVDERNKQAMPQTPPGQLCSDLRILPIVCLQYAFVTTRFILIAVHA